MEKEFSITLDDDHSSADSGDVDSEYALQCRLNRKYSDDKIQKYNDLRWTDENIKYLKGKNVCWKKVVVSASEDHMYTWHDNAIVYADSYGVPCDKQQSNFAAFCEYAASCEEQEDMQEDDDLSKVKMEEADKLPLQLHKLL